jgi:hypothetical protein
MKEQTVAKISLSAESREIRDRESNEAKNTHGKKGRIGKE